MLNLHRLQLCDVVIHHVEDVLLLSRFVEDSIHQFVGVSRSVVQLDSFSFLSRFDISCYVCDRLEHLVAN